MVSLETHFIGTYGKNLLSDWVVLQDIMQECTRWVREKIELQEAQGTPILGGELLTNQKIDDALNGPFQHFFKIHLNAYATISKLETALTLSKEDFFKESENISDITLGLPNYLIERADFSTLKSLRDQLNVLTKEHYSQWDAQYQQWQAMLIAELKVQDLALSDIELQDFTVNQPISELNDQFINLKLPVPKLPKGAFNFQQYWMLKTIIAIQSALGRMHLPNSDKEIDERLKILKPTFKKIDDTDKSILDAQKAALQKLLIPARPKV